MKNMRLLLFSCIIIALSAIGWAFYNDHKTRERLSRDADTPLVETGKDYIPDAAAQAVTDFFLENNRPEEGVLYSVRHYPSDEATVSESEVASPTDESLVGEGEEICCPEDPAFASTEESEGSALERKKSHYERVKSKLVELRGDIPEVDAFIALGRKMSNREQLTQAESLEHYRLMAFFHPSKENLATYEKMKELYSVADPDSFITEYHWIDRVTTPE